MKRKFFNRYRIYLSLIFAIVFLIVVFVIGQKENNIKASEILSKNDFHIKVETKWDDLKKANYVELSWDTQGDPTDVNYEFYRGTQKDELSPVSKDMENYEQKVSETNESITTHTIRDYSVFEQISPGKPDVKIAKSSENQSTVNFSTTDEIKSYYWQLKKTIKNQPKLYSDVVKETINKSTKEFVYSIDQNSNTDLEAKKEDATNTETINLDSGEPTEVTIDNEEKKDDSWLHVMAVDQSDEKSETTHLEMKQMSVKASTQSYLTFNVERTADTAKLVDIAIGADINNKMKSLEVRLPQNVAIKNYDSLTLPTSWYKFQNSDSGEYKSYTFAMNDVNDTTTIKNFLSALQFDISDPVDKTGNIDIVLHELVYTAWKDPSGVKHYYTFVPDVKTWLQAYNLAKKMRYRGLTGYLASLTSLEEHDFVYNNIAKQSGWLGGTRMVFSNGKKINDQQSISENIANYSIATNVAKEWYWADGPDTGLVFFTAPTYAGGGKAPAGVYQGFNNPYSGGNVVEPNNSGGTEAVLEFAQASAGVQTKLWNDLAYNNIGYHTGYYVEFSKYGTQIETEEETDVGYQSAIPQKIVLKAMDTTNQALSFGDIVIDQQLKIGNQIVISPKQNELYDFIELRNADNSVNTSLSYSISNTKQTGTLVYAYRKFVINARQVIVDSNNEVIIPKNGFSTLKSYTSENQLKEEFSLKTESSVDNNMSFTQSFIRYQAEAPLFKYTSIIPENYTLIGYVITTDKSTHVVSNSVKEPEMLDASKSLTYWITVYIKPFGDTFTPYHWEYKTNDLGKITFR